MPSKRPTAGQAESKASSQSSAEVRRLWEEPTEGTDHAVVPVGIPRVQAGEDVNPQQAGVSAGLRDLVVDLHKHSNDHIHSESEIERAQAAVEGVIADRLSALLATAPPEQAALYASGEMVRCSQCLMPLSGAPESHLPNCVVRELQEQHEAKVRDDALEEAAATVNGVHTSYHHNDPAETIGTFVQRHSAAIQELIRSRKDMKNES